MRRGHDSLGGRLTRPLRNRLQSGCTAADHSLTVAVLPNDLALKRIRDIDVVVINELNGASWTVRSASRSQHAVRSPYMLMCTTLAGGKPLNHVEEAWL